MNPTCAHAIDSTAHSHMHLHASQHRRRQTCKPPQRTRRVLPAGALTHLMITIPFWTSELFLGPAWLGTNAVPLAVSALFVLTSGAYLELLVATRSKVGWW